MVETFIDEEIYWEKWIKDRDTDAGDFLIKKYMPLVSYHVQRIVIGLPKNVSREELKSLGMFGLYDALEKFDYSRELKFDTYASFRIRGAIIDGLRKEDWLPRGTRERAKRIEAAIELIEQRNNGKVSVEEIAKEVHLSEEEIYTTMNEQFFANVLSIDEQPIDSEEKDSPSFVLKDKNAPLPEEILLKNELVEELTEIISELSEKEQMVISLFYKEELTLTEIGQVMSLSTSRISQIHSKALFKLRHSLERITN